MVPVVDSVLAFGAVGIDRISVCVVVAAAIPHSRHRRAWSFRITESYSVLAGARFAWASRNLECDENEVG